MNSLYLIDEPVNRVTRFKRSGARRRKRERERV